MYNQYDTAPADLKPYRSIPIFECNERLVKLLETIFYLKTPHPYQALGAPYGEASPWFARESVANALHDAQRNLQKINKGWRFLVFDAYRPLEVQEFLVRREFSIQKKVLGLTADPLSPKEQAEVELRVFRLFAIPSKDPRTPPPHSTGAAIDLTLADETGKEIDMGSPFDENSDRSQPHFFQNHQDDKAREAHQNRELLYHLLKEQGFHRHPEEWWHFSRGDQLWAYLESQKNHNISAHAIYGGVEFIKKIP